MSQSLTEALTDAARAAVETSDWERDQEAWNLPRGEGTKPSETDADDHTGQDRPAEGEADPPDTAPGTAE